MSSPMATIQSLGRALMLPIAVLPVAGLLLRLGQPDMLNIAFMANASAIVTASGRPSGIATTTSVMATRM